MPENDFFQDINSNDIYKLNEIYLTIYDELNDLKLNGKRCWKNNIEKLTQKQEDFIENILNLLDEQEKIFNTYKKY